MSDKKASGNATDLDRLIDAAALHVPFDGWSTQTVQAAARNVGLDDAGVKALCPRGAIDLAVAYHKRADAGIELSDDMADLRYSEKVADLIWRRIQSVEKDVVRRGMALFSLPQHAAEGAALVWGTADAIWKALGDTSDDLNWYSKRAILSGVFSSSVLYWLGDNSESDADTRAYIDRRIADVMRFEMAKQTVREMPVTGAIARGLDRLLSSVHAPARGPVEGYPGWTKDRTE